MRIASTVFIRNKERVTFNWASGFVCYQSPEKTAIKPFDTLNLSTVEFLLHTLAKKGYTNPVNNPIPQGYRDLWWRKQYFAPGDV